MVQMELHGKGFPFADGKKMLLFKVVVQVKDVSKEEAEKVGNRFTRYFDNSDVDMEYWQFGSNRGTANYEFVPQWPGDFSDLESDREALARQVAGLIWKTIGDFRTTLRVKVDTFQNWSSDSTVYIMGADVYWCDFWENESELAEAFPKEGAS